MSLAGFLGVLRRMQMVAVRDMGMVAGLVVRASAMVFRGVAVMLRGGLVVLGGFLVMFCHLASVHDPVLLCDGRRARGG
ncbi:MAG TPA: hypothetical protein VM782_06610 [Stellaceae bacterium]|nr:hypothetical protein [Stellaceae bacterium]